MQRLILLGLNHTTAPIELRERVVFSTDQQRSALALLRAKYADAEFALLSTCNRVEIYAARETHGHPRGEEIVDVLAEYHQIRGEDLRKHVYEKSQQDAVAHLFAVASSLDSMVLGETQILGQVREAYELACQASTARAQLNPLFQRAIAVGKQVMSETALGKGRLSVASVAADYARRIFDQFANKTILCIGAGKMTQLVLRSIAGLGAGRLLVCGRDPAKTADVAQKNNGQSVSFEQLADHLVAADVVISSTGSRRPIVAREGFDQIMKRRRYRPLFIIDLAVPRDVEAQIGELENVYLYNIDDLQEAVSKTAAQRTDAVAAARALVNEHVDQYIKWHRVRELGPVIDALYARFHGLAQDELNRAMQRLTNVSDADRAQLEEMARRMVNKLLHDPVSTLRDGDGLNGSSIQYLHAIEKLFRLNDEDA